MQNTHDTQSSMQRPNKNDDNNTILVQVEPIKSIFAYVYAIQWEDECFKTCSSYSRDKVI